MENLSESVSLAFCSVHSEVKQRAKPTLSSFGTLDPDFQFHPLLIQYVQFNLQGMLLSAPPQITNLAGKNRENGDC